MPDASVDAVALSLMMRVWPVGLPRALVSRGGVRCLGAGVAGAGLPIEHSRVPPDGWSGAER